MTDGRNWNCSGPCAVSRTRNAESASGPVTTRDQHTKSPLAALLLLVALSPCRLLQRRAPDFPEGVAQLGPLHLHFHPSTPATRHSQRKFAFCLPFPPGSRNAAKLLAFLHSPFVQPKYPPSPPNSIFHRSHLRSSDHHIKHLPTHRQKS